MTEFDPGPGWRKIHPGERFAGQEFIHHGWLNHEWDSMMQSETWVKEEEAE